MKSRAIAGCALAVLAACAPGLRLADPAGAESAADLSAVSASGLALACTQAGAELCFNAKDDNCDGVVDEGCGEPVGFVQIIAAWAEPSADVNLELELPGGARVNAGSRSRTGFRMDRDCPRDNCQGQNYESIVAERAPVVKGLYQVEVRLESLGIAAAPLQVNVAARVGPRLYAASVQLTPLQDKATATFTIE